MISTYAEQTADLYRLTVSRNRWIPHHPTPKQYDFLVRRELEVFYGGAAGGGKTDALLMAALQYVDVPSYAAILFRRTYADLSLPGALMDRGNEWLRGTWARWNEPNKTWTFPSGATLTFGYLQTETDKYRYQSAEFQFIAFDEVTQFTESQYQYLFSRLRRTHTITAPLRMRAASNPGGEGHDWVRQRFLVSGKSYGRFYVPAGLRDNPHLDREQYKKSLLNLDPVTRKQLLEGDWDIRNKGPMFQRSWFEIVKDYPRVRKWRDPDTNQEREEQLKRIRYWDLAATEMKPGKDPDWTSGALLTEKQGVFYLIDVKRVRATPLQVERLIRQTAELDGRNVIVCIEQEPGSSGVNTIDHYRREVLKGFSLRGIKTTGSKETRANPFASAAEAGNVKLVEGPWISSFLDELEVFPLGAHDDQVDSASGAMQILTHSGPPEYGPNIWQ